MSKRCVIVVGGGVRLTLGDTQQEKKPKTKVTVPLIRFSSLVRVLPDLLCWLGDVTGGLSASILSLGAKP